MAVAVMGGVAVGNGIVEDRGRKAVPYIAAVTLALGLLLGWALDAFLTYVKESGTMPN